MDFTVFETNELIETLTQFVRPGAWDWDEYTKNLRDKFVKEISEELIRRINDGRNVSEVK